MFTTTIHLRSLLLAGSAMALFLMPTMAETAASDVSSDTIETVRVVGTRQGADALQLKSDATISVLSAADLEHTAVHNVAEALQLLPGVNVTSTGNSFFGGIDGASRGEGMFAQVRGMNSEFTLNMINGIDVAQGMPYSREVQLSLLPPSGLQTIIVNKTAQADMQSDFIGGAVDFRTPTAFDFTQDQTFSATIGGRAETRSMDYGNSGLGYNVAAEGSKKFGANSQFGVYVSGYYDTRQFVNSEMGALMEIGSDNQWAFAVSDAAGNNPAGYNPAKNLETTGFNAGVSSGYTTRFGGTASLDWNIDGSTSLYGRVTYAYAHTEQDSTLSQVLGTNVKKGSSGLALGTTGLYQPIIGSVSTRLWYETNPEIANLGTAQIGGEKRLSDKLTLSGNVFYSWGKNDRPNHIEISTRPSSDFAYGGTSLVTYGADNYPYPTLTQAMIDRLGNVGANPARRSGELTVQHSGQDKMGGKFDAVYTVGEGFIESIKAGAKYETSWRATDNTDWTNAKFSDGRLFSSLGIYNSNWAEVYPGKYSWSVPKIDRTKLFALYNSFASASNADSCSTSALVGICNNQTGRESVASGYAMATLRFGDIEAIPGLRYEHTDIKNVFWSDITNAFTSNKTTYDEVLPSLFVNWRPTENSVYRASVWTSYTRPAFVQLGAHTSTHTDDNGNTIIDKGNSNLKPIEAVNFDVSGQWSSEHGGYIQATAFAKELSNYLYNAGTDYVNAGSSTSTNITQPQNGGNGHVYGLELEFRQKLQDLDGWLSGFGVGGNFTHNWTKVDLGANTTKTGSSDTSLRREQIQNAPDNIANLQLFYEKYGIQFDVLWHYTGSYVSSYDVKSFGSSWDDVWVRPMQRIDLHAGYEIGYGVRADVSVSNLMDDHSYWSHVGKDSLAISDIVDTGRTMLFTIKYQN